MKHPEKLATFGTQYKDKQNKNTTIYVEHHYAQTNTNNVNKTRALLQTTGGIDELNIVCIRKTDAKTRNPDRRHIIGQHTRK